MDDILEIARLNQQKAWEVIKRTDIFALWESIGAKVNLVGSLRSGLLMKNKDVDLHVYSDPVVLSDSFSVMAKFAEHPAIRRIEYVNLLHTEEECIEWHAWYEDEEGEQWKFDMIHIRKGSAYDGYVERVTDRIMELLTPDIRKTILQIKYDIPDTEKIVGIEIYRAVLEGKVRTCNELIEWRKKNPISGVVEWLP